MKFSLLICFIFINVILILLYTSVSKGILLNKYFENTNNIEELEGDLYLDNLVSLKISLLNIKFLRNFTLFSNFAVFFLLNLISSYNLLSFFVSIEGATLCLYVLSGLKTTNRLSIESGLKYFLISAVFSCILGFGLFLIYFTTGSVDFYEIREVLLMMSLFSENYNFMFILANLGLFLILIVFLMKLGAVPYHF
jgi:NADH-quinone oxidoreductase subunit N